MDRVCWQCWCPLEKSQSCFDCPAPVTTAKVSSPPWALLKKWSCPEASSLPHQGLSLTLWCQKSQLKFNELARGLIPSLHPAPCSTPAECPCSKSWFPQVQLSEQIQFLGWVRLRIWLWSETDSCRGFISHFHTSVTVFVLLQILTENVSPDCLNALLPASTSSAPMRSACCWFRSFSVYFKIYVLFLCPGQNCDAKKMWWMYSQDFSITLVTKFPSKLNSYSFWSQIQLRIADQKRWKVKQTTGPQKKSNSLNELSTFPQ